MAHNRTRPRRDHLAVAEEAGFGRVSLLSILAGTLTAYGAFAVLAAVAGATLAAADVETDFQTNDWASSGAVAGLTTAAVLLLCYLFGGYAAGRMARRAGLLHGLGVFVLSIVVGAAVGAVVGGLSDVQDIERNLRSIGVPTSGDEWTGVSVASAVVSLAAILVGAVLGGALGERWHIKLAQRVADPAYGRSAVDRERLERDSFDRQQRIQRDALLHRDLDDPTATEVEREEEREDEPRPVAEEPATGDGEDRTARR